MSDMPNRIGKKKMNPVLKKKWVKALRSGQYSQGTGELVSDDGKRFCCFGVLADIQGAVWAEGRLGLVPYIGKVLVSPFAITLLKPKYAGGVSSLDQQFLAACNDGGMSFKKIADWVEEQL